MEYEKIIWAVKFNNEKLDVLKLVTNQAIQQITFSTREDALAWMEENPDLVLDADKGPQKYVMGG